MCGWGRIPCHMRRFKRLCESWICSGWRDYLWHKFTIRVCATQQAKNGGWWLQLTVDCVVELICINKLHQSKSASQSRLAIQALLQSDPQGFVAWFGILCATWSAVSRGSTFRWYLNPLGFEERPCVASGNLMVSRSGVQGVLSFSKPNFYGVWFCTPKNHISVPNKQWIITELALDSRQGAAC